MEVSRNYQMEEVNLTHRATEPYEVIAAVVLPIVGICLSYYYHFMGAALVIVGLWIFTRHFLGRHTIVTKLLPEKQKSTTLMTFSKTKEDQKKILLLLPETFYSSELSPGFEKFYHIYFYIYTFLSAFTVFWLYAKNYMTMGVIFWFGNMILLFNQIFFIFLHFTVQKKLRGTPLGSTRYLLDYFNEKNEIANLSILEKPEPATGLLENFIEDNDQRFNGSNTHVINIAPYCGQQSSVINEEGIIIINEYSEYNDLVEKLNPNVSANKTYISGLLPFKNKDFSGLSFSFSSGNGSAEHLYQLVEKISKLI